VAARLAVPMPIGGGGLTSTVDDYGRFVRMLLDGGAVQSPQDVAAVVRADGALLLANETARRSAGTPPAAPERARRAAE